jgi:hypothetical protein
MRYPLKILIALNMKATKYKSDCYNIQPNNNNNK